MGALTTRLGGRQARRRRHRRVALAALVLLAVAAFLVFVLGDEAGDPGFAGQAAPVCSEYSDRVQREFELSFPDGVPSDAAFAEYLSHAFADTMDELVGELRALEPGGRSASLVDDLDAQVDEVRSTPQEFVAGNPFEDLAARFDDAGITACGSDFFPDPE